MTPEGLWKIYLVVGVLRDELIGNPEKQAAGPGDSSLFTCENRPIQYFEMKV